jgi:hypothetical protein
MTGQRPSDGEKRGGGVAVPIFCGYIVIPLILVLKMKLFPFLHVYNNRLPRIVYIVAVVNWDPRR